VHDAGASPPGSEPASRREQIVRAAVRVFARRGFLQAEMQEIADEAGLARTGLYQEFSSKEQLFEVALASVLDAVDEVIAVSRPGRVGGPQALAPVMGAVWDWVEAHEEQARLLYYQMPGATAEALRLRQDFDDRHSAAAFVYLTEPGDSGAVAARRWSLTSLVVRSTMVMGLSIFALRRAAAPLREQPAEELRQAAMDVSVRMMSAASNR
jgi:AcrR family transcriptional regulator